MGEKGKIKGYECPKCHRRFKIMDDIQGVCPWCLTPITYQEKEFDPDDYDWPVAAGG
jgi:DNA-directed RNA polymerase subunit RPC12/RpoP